MSSIFAFYSYDSVFSCISYYPSDKFSVACILVAKDLTKKGERNRLFIV